MAETTTFKALLETLRTTQTQMAEVVHAVEAEVIASGQGHTILRGLTRLQQPRLDPHRLPRHPHSLTHWLRTLDTATAALEAMTARWP